MELQKTHRVGARAVVVHDGKILLNEFGDGIYYNLPGGGVDEGELVTHAVIREVLEETGLNVDVIKMLYVLEYEPVYCNKIYGETPQISIVFECRVIGDTAVKAASIPDQNPDDPNLTSKPVWMPVESLENIEYVPYIHDSLMAFIKTGIFEPSFLSEPLSK